MEWKYGDGEELEKIWMDYIRWVFNLDFCTRYIIRRELGIERLSTYAPYALCTPEHPMGYKGKKM